MFKLNISLADKDYLDYNVFVTIRSFYGKKRMIIYRIMMAVIFFLAAVIVLIADDLSSFAVTTAIAYAIVGVAFQIFFNPFFKLLVKMSVKRSYKNGKKLYTPVTDMEFNEESFTEITCQNKSEQKYSVIDRVSIVSDKVIYLHANPVIAFILPVSCFESKEQYDSFLDFIKTKCENIDIY